MKYEIIFDESPESPRDWDNLGTIVYCANRYILGDKKVSRDEIESIENNKNNIVLPVYAYIHGSIDLNTIGFSCPWDSGKSGCIYVSKDKIREHFKVKKVTAKLLSQVKEYLKQEIETYTKYISGEVYGYVIKDSNNEVIDSCFGYYSSSQAELDAQSIIASFNNVAAA